MEEWKLLRSVQERAGLTYAYTFVPSGDTGILYLVDGSPDGQTCAIGQQETLPAENTVGLRRAWSSGLPFVSRVLRYEQWGLLKVSAVPILDSLGHPVAMAGADLEVSVIRRRLRSGLFLAAAASVLAIALSWLLAYFTERRLLAAVRSTMRALIAVSAGDRNAILPQDRNLPREIASMNTTVNRWLLATRDALSAHEGASPEDYRFRACWRSTSPATASCTVLGNHLIAWRRPSEDARSFYFGPERGPVSLLQHYFRPGPDSAAPAWKHPSGVEPFFDSLWWFDLQSGATGVLGTRVQDWLCVVSGSPSARPEGTIVQITIREADV
jgi:hypothetical protein